MLEPSIDALLEKIDSKYTLVTIAARRAREMSDVKNTLIEKPISHKVVGRALEEVNAGKLYIDHSKD
ncbi:DNA-directed RNA polymerase subunit omega [Aciduricibacillus chroicocephali]|uniref:DNA-directed RNA polymerase subunit omega n=1 Tax=Aciduricibacillus chroicocephali TaxID=3054939 RepID=A0ABY9KZ91_9BACI|nr:DNA-directed RNA polymerase subunit omega [Bacillaceae bacterium 44XB]